jgi:hypothetical protein
VPLNQLQSVEGGMFFEDVVKQPVKAFGAVLAAHAGFDRCGGGQIGGNFLRLSRLLADGNGNQQQHRCGQGIKWRKTISHRVANPPVNFADCTSGTLGLQLFHHVTGFTRSPLSSTLYGKPCPGFPGKAQINFGKYFTLPNV